MSTRTGRDRFTELLFYAVLVLMAYLVMLVIWPFLSPLAWAVILGLTLRPVYLHFCVRVSNGNAALLTTLLAGLMMPLVSVSAPLSLFGGVLAFAGLLALGRFFLALGGLDPASAFGGMGSSREMTMAAIAEPALMLAIFTVAIEARSTNLSQMLLSAQAPTWQLLNPAHVLAFAALFIVLLAETGRIPVDNPATHLELTMIHEAMILEYSGRYLALIEWSASIKQLLLMALLLNIFFPVGITADLSVGAVGLALFWFVAKLLALSALVVLVETTNAKLRLFRVPDLLSAAFILGALALLSTCLLYTSDAADDLLCVDLGGLRLFKKKKKKYHTHTSPPRFMQASV